MAQPSKSFMKFYFGNPFGNLRAHNQTEIQTEGTPKFFLHNEEANLVVVVGGIALNRRDEELGKIVHLIMGS